MGQKCTFTSVRLKMGQRDTFVKKSTCQINCSFKIVTNDKKPSRKGRILLQISLAFHGLILKNAQVVISSKIIEYEVPLVSY